jgi:hypothetical protein
MKQPRLFPVEPPTGPHPGEPPVWVKRLVILRERTPGQEPIRNIEFRLGLNIISTRDDVAADAAAVGHNVGKTLLVRLLRYCLGDTQYANSNMRGRIRAALPDAWEIGVIRVRGTTWGVARPLGPGRQSWCLRTDSWEELLGDVASLCPYSEFQQALEQFVPPEFGTVRLDDHDRSPGWTDLLGWLIRDQRCRYTHHNAWRHQDAESGPGVLSLGEANLVTRLTMSLFDVEEHQQTVRLAELRAESLRLQVERDRLRAAAEQSRTRLLAVAPVDGDPADGPLFPGLQARIEEQRASQERLLQDPETRRELDQAEQDLRHCRSLVDRTTGRLEELTRQRELAARQLETASRPAEGEALARQRASLSCGLPGCLHLTTPADALPDPTRADRIREYTTQVEELGRQISSATATRDQQEAAVREAATRYGQARSRHEVTTAGIRRVISRYDVMAEQLAGYEAEVVRTGELEGQLRSLQGQMNEVERQREARADSRSRVMAELNEVFQYVTAALLRQASGELVLNLRDGLAPRPDEATGEAFGTAGKVIGFDLTCLAAGMYGQGRHPRFLVHDSPREADMHHTIYRNLFSFVRALEDRFTGHPPAFQYIITTTTPPPTEVSGEPYVCQTLDAFSPQGRLLRVEF